MKVKKKKEAKVKEDLEEENPKPTDSGFKHSYIITEDDAEDSTESNEEEERVSYIN